MLYGIYGNINVTWILETVTLFSVVLVNQSLELSYSLDKA